MKKFVLELFYGKNSRTNGIIAFIIVSLIVLGCGKKDTTPPSNTATPTSTSTPASTPKIDVPKADASTGKLPTDDQLQAMTKETVLDFNDAVKKEDFSTFWGNISKPFQKQASPEKFKEVFKDFIEQRVDFSEIKDLKANFSPAPETGSQMGYKTLSMKGTYNTTPRTTKFDLQYIAEGKEWKLISIRLSTKDE